MKILSKKLKIFQIKKVNFTTKNIINDLSNLDDILPDHLTETIPKYQKNPKDFNYPWLINGAPFLEIKARFIPEQIFIRSRTSKAELLKHLFKIYRGMLLSTSQYDYDFLSEYCDKTFADKLITQLDNYKQLKYKIEILEDMKANNGNRINPELHLYDCIVLKGLFTDRHKNMTEKNYSVCNDIDNMGFISYIPKYMSDSNYFKTKEKAEEKMKEGEFKNVIFRAYCMFKCGYKLFIYNRFGEKIFDYNNTYNYNHVCIFECNMIAPEKFNSFVQLETYTEWIAKHNFGIWKMIDLDNWMNGNPYFIN